MPWNLAASELPDVHSKLRAQREKGNWAFLFKNRTDAQQGVTLHSGFEPLGIQNFYLLCAFKILKQQ